MRTIASGMDNAFRNTLVVEVKDLFPKMEILNQRRTSFADFERIEVIRYWPALGGSHDLHLVVGELMKVSALTCVELLIMKLERLPSICGLVAG
jgi:hypothetical protein